MPYQGVLLCILAFLMYTFPSLGLIGYNSCWIMYHTGEGEYGGDARGKVVS